MWLIYVVHYTVKVIQTFWLNVPSTATKNFCWVLQLGYRKNLYRIIWNIFVVWCINYISMIKSFSTRNTCRQRYIYSVAISFTPQVISMRWFICYIFMYPLVYVHILSLKNWTTNCSTTIFIINAQRVAKW